MPNGIVNYDYAVIDSCIAMMRNKIAEIQEQTQQLAGQTRALMGTWSGSTADMYDKTSADLRLELDRSSQNLELTRTALQQGAANMMQTDASGARSMPQV